MGIFIINRGESFLFLDIAKEFRDIRIIFFVFYKFSGICKIIFWNITTIYSWSKSFFIYNYRISWGIFNNVFSSIYLEYWYSFLDQVEEMTSLYYYIFWKMKSIEYKGNYSHAGKRSWAADTPYFLDSFFLYNIYDCFWERRKIIAMRDDYFLHKNGIIYKRNSNIIQKRIHKEKHDFTIKN